MKKLSFIFSILALALPCSGSQVNLEQHYSQNIQNSLEVGELKKRTLEQGTKAVPVLINVLKSNTFPEKNRWVAMMMLGKIMGKKSTAYLAHYTKHSEWFMRLAALKALLALDAKNYQNLYGEMLKDNSLLVRYQALENIERMNLSLQAPAVWNMLFDESNYSGKSGKRRRTEIIKSAIRVVGKLRYQKVKSPLYKMLRDKRYQDLYKDIDYSLSLISGMDSPIGSYKDKVAFWNSRSQKL